MTAGGVRAVYVVLTHRDWQQVQRLARAILASSPDARVLICHDSRKETFSPNVSDQRILVYEHKLASDWGSWELVEATLEAFKIARDRWNPQLVSLISGQDYPVRDLVVWEREALAASGWIGEATPLTYEPHWGRMRGEGDDRLMRYAFRWFRAPMARHGVMLPRPLERVLGRVRGALVQLLEPVFGVRVVARGRGRYYGFRRRTPFTRETPCFFGSQWVAVRRGELDRLLDHDLAPGSRLRRFYRGSIIADESAIVTPLSWRGAAADLPPVAQYRWDVEGDTTITWTLADLDVLRASGSPFCRKVDAAQSGDLMDALDGLTARGAD